MDTGQGRLTTDFALMRDVAAATDSRSAEIRAHAAWLRNQPNFDVTLCIHEDWESKGFYLYELNPTGRPTLADAMIAAVQSGHSQQENRCPVRLLTGLLLLLCRCQFV